MGKQKLQACPPEFGIPKYCPSSHPCRLLPHCAMVWAEFLQDVIITSGAKAGYLFENDVSLETLYVSWFSTGHPIATPTSEAVKWPLPGTLKQESSQLLLLSALTPATPKLRNPDFDFMQLEILPIHLAPQDK